MPGVKTSDMITYDAIVLTGGEGTRLGGVDKAMLEVGGVSLLHAAIEATSAARATVVVGPTRSTAREVVWTQEEPTGGGPAAGIIAALAALSARGSISQWVVVIAVDQPGVPRVLPALLDAAAHAAPHVDGLCPHDGRGQAQWMLAAYRTPSLLAAATGLGSGHNQSVRRLVHALALESVAVADDALGNINTWADHEAWSKRTQT